MIWKNIHDWVIPKASDDKKLNVKVIYGVKEIVEVNEPQVRKLVSIFGQ